MVAFEIPLSIYTLALNVNEEVNTMLTAQGITLLCLNLKPIEKTVLIFVFLLFKCSILKQPFSSAATSQPLLESDVLKLSRSTRPSSLKDIW